MTEAPFTTIAESVGSEMGAPQDSNRLDTTLEKPENTDKLSLTDDPNFVELNGTAEEVNVESLAGMHQEILKIHIRHYEPPKCIVDGRLRYELVTIL